MVYFTQNVRSDFLRMCIDSYISNDLSYSFKNHQFMKRNKDCQISVFHTFDSKNIPVVKESYTILCLFLTFSLSFETFFIFQGKTYLASFEPREN